MGAYARFSLILWWLAATVVMTSFPGSLRAEEPGAPAAPAPLLRWDLLRSTVYRPPVTVIWPEGLHDYQGKRVRLEGYLMPRFNHQDPEDLLLSALHPRSIFCGPTDMTALVEVSFAGMRVGEWPLLPVEVTGTFYISENPGNLFWLYHLRAESWRLLHSWEQDFPGVVDEQQETRDEGR